MAGLNHAPPPFFKRGPAPLALLSFYIALSGALLLLDVRFSYLDPLRGLLFTVIEPIQALAQVPGRALEHAGDFVVDTSRLQDENSKMRQGQMELSTRISRYEHLEAENTRLRTLLELKERHKTQGQMASVLHSTRDPFTRKVVIDRGSSHSVGEGRPVIDEQGVIGQITRTFPLASEVTLLTDKDQAVPVQILRTGLRSVAFGIGNGLLELRYLPANADVQNGDVLVTSGLDGIYPSGLPVAKINRIERDTAYSFARIFCLPIAGVEHFSEVMVLMPPPIPPRPEGSLQSTHDSHGDKKVGAPQKRRQKKN